MKPNIITLDLQFQGHPHTIAAYLVQSGTCNVLVECGPFSTFPQLKKVLANDSIDISDIHAVFLTHIHLDHAGAAWALAEAGADIYVHPAGYAHLKNPEKLLASATRIYGDAMDSLWGTMQPIQDEKLHQVAHQELISIQGKNIQDQLTFIAHHTPGHAIHHIAWQCGPHCFTGDVAGISIDGGKVMPPCPPPDISLEDWKSSLQLLRTIPNVQLWLTHFGKVNDPLPHLNALEEELIAWSGFILKYVEGGISQAECLPEFMAWVRDRLIQSGASTTQVQQYESANPSWMSVAGLYRYWEKKKK